MSLVVTADLTQFHREIRALGDRAPLAAARALNKSIASVQTQAVRDVAGDLGIAQKDVRRGMAIQRATRATLRATLTVTGRRIPLIAFRARGPEPSRGRGRVTYRIGASPRTTVAGAFIARMLSGHRGVFKRRAVPRLPIVELFGPSLPRVFTRAKIAAARTRLAGELLAKNLAHEIQFLVRGSRNVA
jgi:hypothetical protein